VVSDTLSVSEVETRASAIVALVSVEGFKQASKAPAWTEMDNFALGEEPSPVSHLRYHAAVLSSQSNGGHRGGPHGTEQVESRLVVTFMYGLRIGMHALDVRLSHDAAARVAKAINQDCDGNWSPRYQGVSTTINAERQVVFQSVEFGVIHIVEV